MRARSGAVEVVRYGSALRNCFRWNALHWDAALYGCSTVSGLRRHMGLTLDLGSTWVAGFAAHSMNDQNGGGCGCFGFGPNARAVSRCGRLTLDRASCRAYSWSPRAGQGGEKRHHVIDLGLRQRQWLHVLVEP